MTEKTVFLFDVDNTLLDNDRVTADLRDHLEAEVGHERQERYWSIFEELRAEAGYADYLGALQRYRVSYPRDLHVLTVSHFLLEYPFHERLFPSALEVVNSVKQCGVPVVLSDGDVVFQPHKIRRSGLYDAFAGEVLIYVHKEFELEDVAQRYPADHYVLVDDKLRILNAVKDVWDQRVTTVFVRQGHYAWDESAISGNRPADHSIGRIIDFVELDFGAHKYT
ncbi:MAG TPA: HAD family hydrolase [Pyrinomonadaceae bacterium]|nr:HAD family hydrolase [Pyrinomonadaceae bacterium]